MLRSLLLSCVLLLASPVHGMAEEVDVLNKLKHGHPRLLVLDEDLARVKQDIGRDLTAKAYFEQLKSTGDAMLKAPPATRVLIGPRLLTVSRQVVTRTSTLGALYRLTGDRRYADRCRDEMLAAAKFENWNPSHFLDVA